jgi:threonine/homoserine/homoserine lactone efflux protein
MLKLYSQGFLVGASNPKALLFFAAFLPQFVDPERAWALQFAILAFTFVVIELTTLSFAFMGCILLAARK